MFAPCLPWTCLILLGVGLVGCEKSEKIRTYSTEKPEVVQSRNTVERPAPNAPPREAPARPAPTPAATQGPVRMFAAIVPQPEQSWFYKLTGPVNEVTEQAEALGNFIAGVRYENGTPSWDLPEGWEQQPGNAFRFATLIIPTETEPLEMSISGLPTSDDELAQALDNINRWRGQVGLEPITAEEIQSAGEDWTEETSLRRLTDDLRIYFVNLKGTMQDTGMRPPFAR